MLEKHVETCREYVPLYADPDFGRREGSKHGMTVCLRVLGALKAEILAWHYGGRVTTPRRRIVIEPLAQLCRRICSVQRHGVQLGRQGG
jgi:hypothetical protein